MPRSSRSKSHKQSKRSSRDYSDFEEDVKMKERNSHNDDVLSVRVSKDSSVSGEKRKLSKDHANGNVSPSKRRKEKNYGESDRWNGDIADENAEAVNLDDTKSKDLVKVAGESKSRRHDVESASVVNAEKDESNNGSGKRGEKRPEKEEGHHLKENREPKDKDRRSERERRIRDGKHEDEVLAESSKQVENQPSKRGTGTNEWPINEELRNIELEKELEKRIRRRGDDKGRYHDDVKDGDERILSAKSGRAKDIKHKDEAYGDKYREGSDRDSRHGKNDRRVSRSRDAKHRGEDAKDNKHREDKYREDGERDRKREDKYREDGNRHKDDKYVEGSRRVEQNRDGKHRQDDDRDYKHKEERYREDVDRDHRHRNGRPREDTDREKRVREYKHKDAHSSKFKAKSSKDESSAADLSHNKTSDLDGSPINDDRVARHKDEKDRRKDNFKDEPTDYRSHNMKDQHCESEMRSAGNSKVDLLSERGRTSSRNDGEITANHIRRRSSPSSKIYPARDHYRVSKQEDTNYRDHVRGERSHHDVNSDYTSGQSDKHSSRSLEKIIQKNENFVDDLSAERRLKSDGRSSPPVDESPSSTGNERRHLKRLDVRRSLDVDELGQKSGGSKDAKVYLDGKGSRKSAMEAHPDNDLSQMEGDDLSVSSRPFSGNYKSLLPPHSPFGSSEDDRGKSNNRHRRLGDPSIGRAQSNWKNVPNWPSPLANGGYLPFPNVPPPLFHPAMQQFVPPIFGRPPLNPGMPPYHLPDGDRFFGHGHPLPWRNQPDESIPPPVHGWEASNAVFGDESHGYGMIDWDHTRNQLNNRMWESSASQKTDQSAHRPTDEIWSGQHVENVQCQLDNIQAETTNNTPEAMKVSESPHISEVSKEDDTLVSQVYLSKIDISEDLTQPELYEQCKGTLDLDQAMTAGEFDSKILFLEEDIEADIHTGASLFAAVDDSVFKKAMALYTNQRVERVSGGHKIVSMADEEKAGSDDDEKPVEEAFKGPVLEVNNEKDHLNEDISTSDKVDDPLVEKPSGGSLVVEFGSVNLSRIHAQSTH